MSTHTFKDVSPAQLSVLTDYVRGNKNRLELPGEDLRYFVTIVSVTESETDGPYKDLTVKVEVLDSYEKPDGDEVRPTKRLLREIKRILADTFDPSELPGYNVSSPSLDLLQRHLDHVFTTDVLEGNRIRNALRRYNIVYLGDLVQLEKGRFDRLNGLGKKSRPIALAVLRELELTLSMTGPVVDEFKAWRKKSSLRDEER